jgi:hypothetical protein
MNRMLTLTGAVLVASLAANADPNIEGLSAEAAARVLSARGVRVLAIGLELPVALPSVPDAKQAQPAADAEATPAARPSREHRRVEAYVSCCCSPELVVIPPKGVDLIEREVLTVTPWRSTYARRH